MVCPENFFLILKMPFHTPMKLRGRNFEFTVLKWPGIIL